MKTKFLRLAVFGFFSWLAPFAVSIGIYPLKKQDEHLFETLMGIILTVTTVTAATIYFRNVRERYVREGILLGMAFVLANLLFDLCMFSSGTMQMPLFRYFKEIGIAYSIMPIISFGIASALARR